jgi:hypothetical protein
MLIAAFVVFVVGLILIICYPINKSKNKRCSEQTEGILMNILHHSSDEGVPKSMHIYSYRVDGVEYQLRTLDHSPDAHQIGDHCTIWYNPRKPKDAQAFRGSDKYLKTILYVGLGLVLLGIVLTFVGFALAFGA